MENTIAQDIVDGVICELCLIYLGKEYGYSVVCQECWNSMSSDERREHQLANSEPDNSE